MGAPKTNPWAELSAEKKAERVAKMLAARKKSKGKKRVMQIQRPHPSEIEVIDVPVNGTTSEGPTRLQRLAALIVEVEKLL